MKSMILKATATNREGNFYYREEHEWRHMTDSFSTWIGAKAQEMANYAISAGTNHSPGQLQVVLESVVDGVEQPPVIATGISRAEMKKFQRMAHKLGDDLLAF